MISRLATILLARVAGFPYVDRSAGLVRPITYEREGAKITIPVAADSTGPECDPQDLRDMVPDEAYRCMVYFEDRGGLQRIASRTRGVTFVAKLRLVCWVNTQKLGSDNIAADRIMQQLVGMLSNMPTNWGPLIGVRETVSAIPQRGAGLFGAYTYPESSRPYLMWPFDAFGIDIDVEFRIRPGCEDEVEADDDACWIPGAPLPGPTPPETCPVVRVCAPGVGQVPAWNGEAWVPVDMPEGGGSSGVRDNVRVTARSTDDVDLTTGLEPGQYLDGIELEDGMLVLLMDQADPAQNGIYVVGAGAAQRAAGFTTWDSLVGLLVLVSFGDTYADTAWVSTTAAGGTLGTDPIPFEAFPFEDLPAPFMHGAGPLYARQAGTYSGTPTPGGFRADSLSTAGTTRLTFADNDEDGNSHRAGFLAVLGGGVLLAFHVPTGRTVRWQVTGGTAGVSKVTLEVDFVCGDTAIPIGQEYRWLAIQTSAGGGFPGSFGYVVAAGDPDTDVPAAGTMLVDVANGADATGITLVAVPFTDLRGEDNIQSLFEILSALGTGATVIYLNLNEPSGKYRAYVVYAGEIVGGTYVKLAVAALDGTTVGTPINHGESWYLDAWWYYLPSAAPAWGAIGGTLSDQTDLQNALNAKAASSHASQHQHGGGDEVGTATPAANAIPKADGSGKLDVGWMPASLLGKVEYQGTWAADTNTPAIPAAGSSNKGHYYVATGSCAPSHGYTNVPAEDFEAKDWIISNGTAWEKVDNTEVSLFIAQTDTPASYSGQAAKIVRVNATEDEVEFADADDVSTFLDGATDPFLRTSLFTGLGNLDGGDAATIPIPGFVIDGGNA